MIIEVLQSVTMPAALLNIHLQQTFWSEQVSWNANNSTAAFCLSFALKIILFWEKIYISYASAFLSWMKPFLFSVARWRAKSLSVCFLSLLRESVMTGKYGTAGIFCQMLRVSFLFIWCITSHPLQMLYLTPNTGSKRYISHWQLV